MFQVFPAVLRNVFWPGVGKREGCWGLLIVDRGLLILDFGMAGGIFMIR